MGETRRVGGGAEWGSVDPGWSLQEVGAENVTERVWLCTARPDAVTIAMEHEGGHAMRVVPCAVLAHVLRVHGYEVAVRAEAAE